MNNFKDFQNKDLQLITSELYDSGNMATYHFTWREYLGVIEGPSVIDVVINPDTGDLLSYVGINRDVSIPLGYKISKEQAINSAIDHFKGIDIQNIESKLKVWYDDEGSQKLIWFVTILGSHDYMVEGGTVFIDANSGEIIEIDEFI
jgi:Zn-dependent metalloprotease